MVDGAGSIGPRLWHGLQLHRRSERWAEPVITRVRAGTLSVPNTSAVHHIAWYRDQDGALLPASAAVELLNVLRPTVAVARFITTAALALHQYPASTATLRTNDAAYLGWFVQEVRRFYPFFPMIGGRARRPFVWRGHRIRPGTWVLLDVTGTNHDPRSWETSNSFRPERFRDEAGPTSSFIPQCGGDVATGHRCPGEELTVALIQQAVQQLTTAMRYEVPPRDLHIDRSRIPALPRSRFVLRNVRRQPAATRRAPEQQSVLGAVSE